MFLPLSALHALPDNVFEMKYYLTSVLYYITNGVYTVLTALLTLGHTKKWAEWLCSYNHRMT